MKKVFVVSMLFVLGACSKTFQMVYPTNSLKVDFAVEHINQSLKTFTYTDNAVIRLEIDTLLEKEGYSITAISPRNILVKGGDETGLMYGGLELAELISFEKDLPELKKPIENEPFIKQRGLKFNIPLDIRTPSYQDAGDAAQKNIAEMWNMEFWKSYLDMMAQNRYNVLTLWNPNPFPSMIHLEDYPDVTLENVCGTSFPLDVDRPDEPVAKFIAGSGVSQQVLDNLVILKEMTMDEKIAFWREVMTYAKSRGVEVYFITWSIWMNSLAPPGWYREQQNLKGKEGKYGINNDQTNDKTIAYLRAAVKEFVLTYPDLAGIGLTAGENMETRDDEYDREKWLWNTYGKGIVDAKNEQPDREVKFVHRFWQSGVDKIVDDFMGKYPDKIDLSFKYARARMYATPDPKWANEYIEELKKYNLKSWWNIRNDDIFHFRWGDADYTSKFFKHLPPKEVTAGYFMGSDGYVWGREFISKHPKEPRELEIDKHWYNFMLWGRMGYDPNMSAVHIKGMLGQKYPNAPVEELQKAWATASSIPSLVTKFHWNSWDFMWAVEGCLDLRKGFHTVEDFITNPTMDFTGVLSIRDYVTKLKKSESISTNETTPLQLADQLDNKATAVHQFLEMEDISSTSIDYAELLYDLKAWAYMGNYYANKIRGAYHLHAFRQGLGAKHQQESVAALQKALTMWKAYASAATRNYTPQFMAKTRTIDWEGLIPKVEDDIKIAQNEK